MPCCWTVAHHASLSMRFLRQEYGSGCHFLLCKIVFWRYFLLDCGFHEGRGTPSRAWEWVLVWHLEMNCLRRRALSKQETLLGRGAEVEGRSMRETESLCQVAHSLRFYGYWVSFWFVSGQSFCIGILPGGTHITQPRWIPVRRILGGW